MNPEQKILIRLLKDKEEYNSRNISKLVGVSHVGAYKILKNLEKRKIVTSRQIGKAIIYSINKENSIALKEIELDLMLEAEEKQRWLEEFKALKSEAKFVILFGSAIRNEKEAKDIDLLVVAEKNNLKKIKNSLYEKNNLMIKKIHPIIQTENEFKQDLKNKNKVLLEIIKTGIILYGQNNFIEDII